MEGFPRGLAGYAPVELLGRGTSALVFKAWQQSTGQFVAIKTAHASDHPGVAEHFAQEARWCSRLAHPHIVRLIDAGMAADKRPYSIFEFIPGQTLREFVLCQGSLEVQDAVELMGQLLDALACVHARGLVHRDLKPQNILVMTTGACPHIKLIDFGIAALQSTGMPVETKFATHTATRLNHEVMPALAQGTPGYCAPEQLQGAAPAASADLYAWGLLFLECLTGQPAIPGGSVADILRFQLGPAEIALPAMLRGHPLGELLRQVLYKDVRRRTVRTAELCAALRPLLYATPYSPVGHAPKRPPNSPEPENSHGSHASAVTVLCLSLMLTPLAHASIDLDLLDNLQDDQIQWCMQTVSDDCGQLAGVLGDRLIFHDIEAEDGDSLRRIALATLGLRNQVARRSRLLEIQYGVRLDLRAGLHATMREPGRETVNLDHATNVALHLNRIAAPGAIVTSASVQQELQYLMQFAAPADSENADKAFTLQAGQPAIA